MLHRHKLNLDSNHPEIQINLHAGRAASALTLGPLSSADLFWEYMEQESTGLQLSNLTRACDDAAVLFEL